jgi:type I restriction enzyme R subunit
MFPDLFRAAIARINPGIGSGDIDRLLADVKLSLENEDLGKAFYEKLTECSDIRLIDFADFDNNSFHVVTELTCKNGDDEFRPDITQLINGMPLTFIEVKKPNNREGVLAERNRIITRCRNPRFRRFINITQLMVFSNNLEYDDGSPQRIEGAFYAGPSYDAPIFNYFREEEELNLADLLADVDDAVENEVLRPQLAELSRSIRTNTAFPMLRFIAVRPEPTLHACGLAAREQLRELLPQPPIGRRCFRGCGGVRGTRSGSWRQLRAKASRGA